MTTTATTRIKAAVAAAVAGITATASSVQAQSTREAQLEFRIHQLEQRVRELDEQLGAAPLHADVPDSRAANQSVTPNALAGTRFSFSGFMKIDALRSDYDDGEAADGSIGRDFYVPGAIPVGGMAESADFDSHVKQSRFIFRTDTDTDSGKLSSLLEVDLYGSSLGDERATNTYGLQLRHAYVQYGAWLFGQTWSNFQDVAALPESTDFIGPTDGTVFVRQPQLRYTAGSLAIALENPEITLTPAGGGTRIASDDGNIPDLTLAYRYVLPHGYLRAAALARQLRYQTTGAMGVGAINDTQRTAALSLSGKIDFGVHDLRFMATAGEGIGRYVGVNFANDAELTSQGQLRPIDGWAGFAAWRQVWTGKLRSTFMLSTSQYDNDIALSGPAANKSSWSWAVNTFYTPYPKLDVGLEWRHAVREIESGAEGSFDRLHAVAKYSF